MPTEHHCDAKASPSVVASSRKTHRVTKLGSFQDVFLNVKMSSLNSPRAPQPPELSHVEQFWHVAKPLSGYKDGWMELRVSKRRPIWKGHKPAFFHLANRGPLKMVAKRRLLPNTDLSTQFILTQTDKKKCWLSKLQFKKNH